ncbi:AP-1 complex subunit gamma-1 [Trichomonascus vanleenenianus]|uniref:AP-1 complex subunit gamma n=1 Tax=Trichomonascus vanleenenianus TaxID=2268995 RepID=UPI003ECADC8F
MTSLKSFIKAVRAAKTIADERAVIQKESAAIRTSFRENYTNHFIRRQNVAKLLYLFTLGERTHFGQVECLKLLATSKFTDKRLGYLGTMLLLDESQEVLTLVTNSLANDLSHPNQYVVALALCTLANIASTEMARDLFGDIEKIISSSNPYLKKKAALCAMRIITRVPDLEEVFVDKAKALMTDKNHGVLLCGCALVQSLCEENPDLVPEFKPLLPTLLNHLKNLSTSGYAPEHDVTGISDPFLQVRLLRLLRIFGEGDVQTSEQLSDILAQIASNTDSSKNVGNAVLYEAVRTIFGIEADSGLRVLGVNLLGKFLSKDNNTKYVALNTLLNVIEIEPTAVQRHRATIIDCLKDADISIRRRALELSFALINSSNIRVLVRELLTFLETADAEFRTNLVSQIAVSAEKYAPNTRWHIDTILRALKVAGDHAKENVLSAFITLVITSEDLHLYTVQKLYAALRKDMSQQGLVLVGVWLIGEYANVLLKGGSFEDEGGVQNAAESDIVSLLETILDSTSSEVVREYVVTALMKLTTRISSTSEVERIKKILESNNKSLDLEVQQRIAEYCKLFNHDSVRRGVLEKMPPPEVREDLGAKYEAEKHKKKHHHPARRTANGSAGAAAPNSVDLLLDFAGEEEGNGGNLAPAPAANNADLLSDIFGTSTPSPPVQSPQPQKSNASQILDLFDSVPATNSTPKPVTPAASTPPIGSADLLGGFQSTPSPTSGIEAYSKNSLTLSLVPQPKISPGVAAISAQFVNSGSSTITDLVLQVAVPKSQKLQLQGLSSTTLGPDATATQNMRVSGPENANVKLRLRIAYKIDGQEVKEQIDFNKFPANML